ncbi:MAG: hypothetical protein ABSA59_14025, partial [Terriglobia bacterium]
GSICHQQFQHSRCPAKDVGHVQLPQGGEGNQLKTKTKNSSSLSPLGERGDRKAVGEGVTHERIEK